MLSFPLYVDSIPAGLLWTLTELEQRLKGSQGLERTLVYPLVNCGFFEAAQNRLAISMVWAWCESCGLGQGRALALGGGEMLGGMPAGKGPLAALDKSLDELAQDILADPPRRKAMGQKMAALGNVDAAERIYAAVMSLCRQGAK